MYSLFISSIWHNHRLTPVLVRSLKLSNDDPDQYQMGKHLEMLGAVCRWMSTPPWKNLGYTCDWGIASELNIPMKLPSMEETGSTHLWRMLLALYLTLSTN